MGAFLALQAKRVSWSTLARKPQLNRVHTVKVNAAHIPGFAHYFAGDVAQIHPCGQAPEFFELQRPDPEASCALALDIHYAGCEMRATRHARTFLGSCWLKQAFTPTFV